MFWGVLFQCVHYRMSHNFLGFHIILEDLVPILGLISRPPPTIKWLMSRLSDCTQWLVSEVSWWCHKGLKVADVSWRCHNAMEVSEVFWRCYNKSVVSEISWKYYNGSVVSEVLWKCPWWEDVIVCWRSGECHNGIKVSAGHKLTFCCEIWTTLVSWLAHK